MTQSDEDELGDLDESSQIDDISGHYNGIGKWTTDLPLPRHFFTHFAAWRRIWEYLAMFLAIFSLMEILFIFFIDPEISMPLYCITFLIDIFFVVDHYIIGHTAILIGGDVIFESKKLWERYGSFKIHLVSCIPLAWIGIVAHNKWVYLALSITKILRVLRARSCLKVVRKELPYARELFSILPFFFFLIFTVHLFAVIFVVTARAEGFAKSFLAGYYLANYSDIQLYFVSVYFVLTTILTIGFGDISPNTTGEVILTIFIQLFGVSMQTVITSFMVSYLLDPDEETYVQHYDVVQDFLHFKKVGKSLQRDIRNFYQYQWETVGTGGSLHKVLKRLPVSIQTSIKHELTRGFFGKSNFLRTLTTSEQLLIDEIVKIRTYAPGDIIAVQGNPTEKLLLFRSGIIQYIVDGTYSASRNISDGYIYGEAEFLTREPRPCGLKAQTVVEVWVLRRDEFSRLVQTQTTMRERISDAIQVNMPDIFARLNLAQSKDHQIPQ